MQSRRPGRGQPPPEDMFFQWVRSRVQEVRVPECLRARIEAMLAVERSMGCCGEP